MHPSISELLQSGKWEAAMQLLQSRTQQTQAQPSDWYNLALCQSQLGQLQKAEVNLRECLSRDPLLTKAWYLLGEVSLVLGNQSQSIQAFTELILVHPYREESLRAKEKLQSLSNNSEKMS